jgi:hypothetical protein
MRTAGAAHEHVGGFRQISGILGGKPWSAHRIKRGNVRRSRVREQHAALAAQHSEVLVIGDLLISALAIVTDLRGRLAKEPNNRVLLLQRKQYERLVGQLQWEHKTALAQYLATIQGLVKR